MGGGGWLAGNRAYFSELRAGGGRSSPSDPIIAAIVTIFLSVDIPSFETQR